MKYFLYTVFIFLSSCSGYNFHYQENPFASHGIKTVAIPAFLNKSLVPNISALMTERISTVFSQETPIKIYSGNSDRADATLIGIITSSDRRNDFYKTDTTTLIGKEFSPELSKRREFYAPSVTSYELTLSLILIKRPTQEDLKLIDSDYRKYLDKHPRVIFSTSQTLSGSYTRVLNPSDSPDGGGAVNSTKNKEVFNKSLDSLATDAATNFKETVLNAF